MNNLRLTNIHNSGRKIYLFIRDEKGNLSIQEDNSFFSYYYEVSNSEEGSHKSFDGKPLKKIFTTNPSEIRKSRTNNAYEADILLTARYKIDKIDKIEKTNIKIAYIDIEITAPELPSPDDPKYPICSISVGNSYTRKIKTFWIKNYKTEFELIEDFIKYMQQEKFDLMLGWNLSEFDYPYLTNRIPDFPIKISPIGQARYGDGKVLYPAGISIVDYLSWTKKVTLNREESYALDYLAQKHLGEKEWKKTDFSKVTDDIREKNINDIRRMVKLEEKFKIVEFFDEIRRLSKVDFEDMIWFSRSIDMLMLEEAKNQKIVLPMKPSEDRGTLEEKIEYQGAYREVFQTGVGFGYSSYDLSSAYPSMMVDFCLDPSNIKKADYNNALNINGTYFNQNPNAIIPKVAKKLMDKKLEIKNKLENTSVDSPEHKDLETLYKAIKGIVNSLYGVCALRFFRVYNTACASATTFLVRDLLHYVIDELKKIGYKTIYTDTDGILVDTKEDISELLNQLVKSWAKKYGKEKVMTEFSYEGFFKNIIILALCRYEGELVKPNGETELKRVGLEIRRKDSTTYMKNFQAELLRKIRYKEDKVSIINWIKKEIENLPNQKLEDIAFPCKLSKDPKEYKNEPIFARSLKYTQEINPNFKKPIGERYYYIYTKPFGYEEKVEEKELIMTYDKSGQERGFKNLTDKRLEKAMAIENKTKEELEEKGIIKLEKVKSSGKSKNVIAFDVDNQSHINRENIDWKLITERNILNKIDVTFTAMDWDITEITGKKVVDTPKKTPKTCITEPTQEDNAKKDTLPDNQEKVEIKPFYEENKDKNEPKQQLNKQPIENKEVIEKTSKKQGSESIKEDKPEIKPFYTE